MLVRCFPKTRTNIGYKKPPAPPSGGHLTNFVRKQPNREWMTVLLADVKSGHAMRATINDGVSEREVLRSSKLASA